MTFFAVAGEATESASITPLRSVSAPPLPAENVIVVSGCSHTKPSVSSLSYVYSPAAALPHESEWMRAPAAYAWPNSEFRSRGMPVR